MLLLQVNQTLSFRSDGYKADTKDVLAPNPCVAGQLGPTAEPSSCKVQLKATGALLQIETMHVHLRVLFWCAASRHMLRNNLPAGNAVTSCKDDD
jgi:hypothetical protein